MNTFLCQSVRRLLAVAAAIFCGASAARATGIDAFTLIDIMETVRQSEVESPFTFSTTGENDGSHSEQLFDGDLTADSSKDADQNGRAIFTISKGPSITVSFNPAVFGNRQLFLQQYGFRMWHHISAPAWNIVSARPRILRWPAVNGSKDPGKRAIVFITNKYRQKMRIFGV